jgi:malic enzyme
MSFRVGTDSTTGERYLAVRERGRALLINPFTNKGSAFTLDERRGLGLEGLLPRAVSTLEQQAQRCYEHFSAKSSDLEKFIYLAALQDRNEVLYFRLLLDHIDEMMPVVYTPVVGAACQAFSHIYRRARGLYVGYDGRGAIGQTLVNYHAEAPAVAVVTDGERILGLGDQGAGGMGIPIGKLCLYTLCAGVPPITTVPILLDVGTDNEERLADPLYLGLRQRRVRGGDYQTFVDEFVDAVSSIWPHVLLQFEDFLKGNAIKQLARFRNRLCMFNDDIQGTAAVTLAGLYGALSLSDGRLAEQRIVTAGAGASAKGIADLLVEAMVDEGSSISDAEGRIWMVDSRGLVARDRTGLADFKQRYARTADETAAMACHDRARIELAEVVAAVKPTVLIGTSACPGLFTEDIVRTMAVHTTRPIIFALSNPTSKTEVSPAHAITWTGGRAIVATGSPFAPVEFEGRRYRIGQCNNALIFPGIGLGVWVGGVRRVTERMFLDAARALAATVQRRDLEAGSVFPTLDRIRDVSCAVACAVIRCAVAEGQAEPSALVDLEATVRRRMWYPEYLPVRYEA